MSASRRTVKTRSTLRCSASSRWGDVTGEGTEILCTRSECCLPPFFFVRLVLKDEKRRWEVTYIPWGILDDDGLTEPEDDDEDDADDD